MARTVAALKAGRARWLAKLRAERKPIPGGRKAGGRNLPKEEREHAEYEKQCSRQLRDLRRQIRSARKQRRAEQRQDARLMMEEHARRKARMDAGLPYWTPEELEKL
jgi:hypothetical protein